MLIQPPDSPFYEREAEIIRLCGWTSAGVYDVLRHLTQPDGSGPTHQEVAQKLGINPRTARRSIDKLIEAGVIKAESRWNGHQAANCYSFSTRIQGGQNVHLEDSPGSSDESDVEEQEPEVQEVQEPGVASSSELITPSLLPGENRRAPWRLYPRNHFFYTHLHTWDLVDLFTDLVMARDIQERGIERLSG